MFCKCANFRSAHFLFLLRSLRFPSPAVLMSLPFCHWHGVEFLAVLISSLAPSSSSRFRRRLDLVAVRLSSSEFRVVLFSAASAAWRSWLCHRIRFASVSIAAPSPSRRRVLFFAVLTSSASPPNLLPRCFSRAAVSVFLLGVFMFQFLILSASWSFRRLGIIIVSVVAA